MAVLRDRIYVLLHIAQFILQAAVDEKACFCTPLPSVDILQSETISVVLIYLSLIMSEVECL